MQRAGRLDPKTRDLVAFAAAVAQGDEPDLRDRLRAARASGVPAEWIEELLLQSILMCGYPRALIAFGLWRSQGWGSAPADDPGTRYEDHPLWAERGERTCAAVYGDNYRRLRDAIRDLHPAVDAWMVTEGYGRTIGRPGLDLVRRELCTLVQCAILDAPRQLHSHLRGALNVGAAPDEVEAALSVVNAMLSFDQWKRVKALWKTIREGWES